MLPEEERKGPITRENIFSRITDIAGIRILHLHLSQFENIHNEIMKAIDEGEYALVEKPKAYTWDPESTAYFERLGLPPHVKESFYTSIHYVIKPNGTTKLLAAKYRLEHCLKKYGGN